MRERRAASTAAFSFSGVETSGTGAPSFTTTPTPTRASATRLVGARLPALSWMSIAGTAGDALAKLGILDEVQGKTLEMKLPRRNFLHLAAGAAALPAVSRFAWLTWPRAGRARS